MDDRTRDKIAMFAGDIADNAERALIKIGPRGLVREVLERVIHKADLILQLTLDEETQKLQHLNLMRQIMAAEDPPQSATELAEAAAAESETEELLDDPNHPIWDWALEAFPADQGGDDR